MVRGLFTLSSLLNLAYMIGVCLDTKGGIGHWRWAGLNPQPMMLHIFTMTVIDLMETTPRKGADGDDDAKEKV
ncbi:hypothetical protein BGW39_006969 [Mortierella sp. 14UC]|nr:hypothetical protein BGW39_006969 [Mortierella sp. 14UC]